MKFILSRFEFSKIFSYKLSRIQTLKISSNIDQNESLEFLFPILTEPVFSTYLTKFYRVLCQPETEAIFPSTEKKFQFSPAFQSIDK